MSRPLHAAVLVPLLIAVVALAACGDDERTARSDAEPLRVVAGFYPLFEAARAIGGDAAQVVNLTPTGSGPHDLELAPRDAARVEDADLALYLGSGFQPSVEKAAESASGLGVDLLSTLDLRTADDAVAGVRGEVDGERLDGERDPHVWVDPAGFLRIVDEIERAFTSADPARSETWQANARRYRETIADLDRDFRSVLARCRTRTLVTSHAAFGYLADRYGLVQAPIAGISPDDEPDPQSLAAVARRAKADGVRTVYFESLVPRALADTVAREIGARTDALDPVEGLDADGVRAGKTYVSIQRDNLDRLRRGLGCTGE